MRLLPPFITTLALGVLLAAHATASGPSDACLAGCADASLSDDDRATCRVACQQVSTPPQPTAATPRPSTPDAACEASCNAEPTPTDRATCRLQCTPATATTTPPAKVQPPPPPPPTQPKTTTTTTTTRNAAGQTVTTTTTHAQPTPAAQPPQPKPLSPTFTYPPPPPPTRYPTSQPQPATAQKSPGEIATCKNTCTTGSTTDRATCRLQCSAQPTLIVQPARSLPTFLPTPPAPPPTPTARQQQCAARVQGCISSCVDRLPICAAECTGSKLSATDHATCELNCDAGVEACNNECRSQEHACLVPHV